MDACIASCKYGFPPHLGDYSRLLQSAVFPLNVSAVHLGQASSTLRKGIVGNEESHETLSSLWKPNKVACLHNINNDQYIVKLQLVKWKVFPDVGMWRKCLFQAAGSFSKESAVHMQESQLEDGPVTAQVSDPGFMFWTVWTWSKSG